MTRFVLLALLLPSAFSLGRGQPIRTYGIKIGVIAATWNWKAGSNTIRGIDRRLGLDLGAAVEWLQMPIFSLLTEAHFVQKGMKENTPITTEQYPDGTGEFTRQDIRLDALSLGVLPKVRFEAGIVEVYAIAGLRLDFSLSNRIDVEGPEPIRSTLAHAFQSVVDAFVNPQVGGTVGCGANVHALLPLTVGLELRYSPNLQVAYSWSASSIKNTSFEFLLTLSR